MAGLVTLWRGAHTRAGLLTEVVTPQGTHAGPDCSVRTATCGKDPCWSSLCEGTHMGEVHGGLTHGKDSMLEQGKSVRRKEEQRQCVMN